VGAWESAAVRTLSTSAKSRATSELSSQLHFLQVASVNACVRGDGDDVQQACLDGGDVADTEAKVSFDELRGQAATSEAWWEPVWKNIRRAGSIKDGTPRCIGRAEPEAVHKCLCACIASRTVSCAVCIGKARDS